MDNLLNGIYEVFSKVLPLVGCIALIALVVLMNKLILFLHDISITLKKVNGTIDQLGGTVDQVNGTLDKFQTPVDTIVNISRSADKVNAYSNKVVADAVAFISENLNVFLDWLKEFVSKYKKEKEEAGEAPLEVIIEKGTEENE